MEKGGIVYILTNKNKTTLYIGVTSNLPARIYEHQKGIYKRSFTYKYNVHYLIYYEFYPSIEEAIFREKQLKKWRREKKEQIINSFNPEWKDLSDII